MEVARQNLYRNLQNPEAMARIDRGIEEQREHFDTLGLHIGYVYGSTLTPDHASFFKAVCVPGARLPHAWIHPLAPLRCTTQQPPIDSSYVWELSQEQIEAKKYSTLDLCAFDRFTLLVSPGTAERWKSLLQDVRSLLPAPTDAALKMDMVVFGVDFQLAASEQAAEWAEVMRLDEGQATLVRPDQHILDCFDAATTATDIFDSLKSHLQW